MSRLIIKGLPKRLEEDELRKLFAFAGDVTDAKVIRNRDGVSRQFGFVGFRREADAAKARKRLNGTYVQASRVLVEVARAAGDPSIPRPWSKHSKGSSAFEKRMMREEDAVVEKRRAEARKLAKDVREKKRKEALEAKNDDGIDEKDREAFGAFKEAVGKRTRNPLWADGAVDTKAAADKVSRRPDAKDADGEKDAVVFSSDDEDEDDEYQELPADSAKEKQISEEEKNLKANPIALDDAVSDADYFKSKVSNAINDEDSEDGDESGDEGDSSCGDGSDSDESGGDDEMEEKEASGGVKDKQNNSASVTGAEEPGDASATVEDDTEKKPAKKNGDGEVDAAETGRLFVRNLSFNVTEDDLEQLFEKYGTLADVHLITDSATKRSRGVAFILYVVPENAVKAMAALDGTIFSGRLLHVLPGRPRPGKKPDMQTVPGADSAGMNTFKRGREEARAEAAKAGADANAQNAMYLGADAVAETVAQRLGVSKSELYGADRGDSGAAAVRLAVAEATVQAETREFLLENGVDLSKASGAVAEMNAKTTSGRRKRLSRTAFLAKNLPARTKAADLQDMFSKFGTLRRLALAPSGLLAVIEYSTAGEAKRAYGGLAYKRYRDMPLYLEWLPSEALTMSKNDVDGDGNDGENAESKAENESVAQDGADKQSGVLVNASTVYVKNLNFDTREEALKTHFKQVLKRRPELVKGMRAVTVATKKNPTDPTAARLSMGFGFAEFASTALAGEAVKLAQGTKLDGHTLELRLSNRIVDPGSASVKKRGRGDTGKRKASAKIIVRNIAFEASAKDIRSLFATFGQIKSVRLPRKMDGSHRGFGFLEFVSKGEAKAAMAALNDAHLYGRHLVVEYADEESNGFASMEKLQEMAAKQMPRSKRRKIDGDAVGDGEDVADDEEKMRDEMY